LLLNQARLRRCPKCITGVVFLDRDKYGAFISCRNCGWHRDLAPGQPLPKVSDHDQDFPEPNSDGCLVSVSCFSCPLPECAYEAPASVKLWLQDRRVLAVFAKHQHLGTTRAVRATAKALQVTERTVFRALARNKHALGAVGEEATA
jgi:hypothetical protein